MIIATIPLKDYEQAFSDIQKARTKVAGFEFRLDYLTTFHFDKILFLKKACELPVIFTLRKVSQGGHYPHTETQRLNDILELGKLNPDYIDLEYDTPNEFIEKIKSNYPRIQLIGSFHDFEKTPEDITSILNKIQEKNFSISKIAVKANSSVDALKMLSFVNHHSTKNKLTGISMGEIGQCTRLLSQVIGNQMTYISIDAQNQTAPGQLSLLEVDTFKNTNKNTKLFALLGDPIDHSLGHILHNQAIRILHENAIYLKLKVQPNELPKIMTLCKTLPFAGFSITMPHKEKVFSLVDNVEPASLPMKAINTIHCVNKFYLGSNTDGKGALKALSEKYPIKNQRIIILGAGGAARAIATEAFQQSATITIVNRTLDRALAITENIDCEILPLDKLHKFPDLNADILINTLPDAVFAENSELLLSHYLSSNLVVMDINYQPIHTHFLSIAKNAGCKILPGYEMYIHQAILQIQKWFQPSDEKAHEIENFMRSYFRDN